MESFRLLIDICASILESFYLHKVLLMHFNYKDKRGESFLLFFVLLGGLLCHFGNLNDEIAWGTILFLVEVTLFSFSFLQGNKGIKLLVVAIALFVIVCNDMLLFLIYMLVSGDMTAYSIMEKPFLRGLMTIITKGTLFLILTCYIKFYNKKKVKEYQFDFWEKAVLLMILCSMTILTSSMHYVYSNYYYLFFLIYAVFILSNIIFFYLLKKRTNNIQLEILLCRMDVQKQEMYQIHFDNSINVFYRLKEMRHDLKHHVAYMDYLLQEEKYKELQEYLGEIEHGK